MNQGNDYAFKHALEYTFYLLNAKLENASSCFNECRINVSTWPCTKSSPAPRAAVRGVVVDFPVGSLRGAFSAGFWEHSKGNYQSVI